MAGITFVSHIAPASMTLLAFAALGSPALSGVLLAMSTGVGFYPAFMAPAWLGFYWNDVTKRTRFAIGFGLAAAIIAGGVYAMSQPAGERSRLGTIMYDTFGHHTDPRGYGSSAFGFWGQREGIRRVAEHAARRRFGVHVAGVARLCGLPRVDLFPGPGPSAG